MPIMTTFSRAYTHREWAFMGSPTTSTNKFKMADGSHIEFRKMLIYWYWMKIYLHPIWYMQHGADYRQ